jgi:two-component system, cell cycle sensor histidine kinase and response regulator CckA
MHLVHRNASPQTADARDTRQIAHGFNNALAVIGGHTEILLEALPEDSPLRRSLTAILESTTHAATLTRKLFDLAHQRQPAMELVDPSRLFLRVEADARRKFGSRISVDAQSHEPLWLVRADAAQMELAISTIASYAIDAMPYGGSITFRASNADVRPSEPAVHAFVNDGRYVRFDVVCSRTLGVHEQLSDFEPLRERAAREGVDLARVFALIKSSGGYLWIGTDEATAETALTVLWPTETPGAIPSIEGWRTERRAAESV